MGKRLDLVGERYGRLVVTGAGEPRPKKTAWACMCDCGSQLDVITDSLRSGTTKSCGCLNRELKAERLTTHGMKKHPLYTTWLSMRTRCNNPKSISYQWYGALGIKVCERWNDFSSFVEDMGDRPDGCTIDRIDTLGDYLPGNCRWATQQEQDRNKSSNRMITINGETKCLVDWAQLSGIPGQMILRRLDAGWEPEDAVAMPKGSIKPGKKRIELSLNGETRRVLEWAEITGLSRQTIISRINLGWTDQDILTRPARKLSK